MKITVVREGDVVRVLEVEGELPPGRPVQFFSRAELDSVTAGEGGVRPPGEPRGGIAPQWQAEFYREWMEETEWDAVELSPEGRFGKSLAEFKP